MDEGIRSSIQTRRDTITNYYVISGEIETKVENLFSRIGEFASSCSNQADFEQKFAASELNTEYLALFNELAPYVRLPEGTPSVQQQMTDNALETAKSAITHQAKMEMKSVIINSVPDDVAAQMIHKENLIPGVLELKTIGNVGNILGRFRKNKNKPEDETE